MNRRSFLLAAAGAVAGVWWLRPENRGRGGHDGYFSQLSAALKQEGLARPTMIVDLDRLDANIEATGRAMRPRAFRVVAKSLPSAALLDYVRARAETRRLMVFHQPFLNAVAAAHPDAEMLLGKPGQSLGGEHVGERIATVDRLVGTASPAERRRILELADNPQLHVFWSQESAIGQDEGEGYTSH